MSCCSNFHGVLFISSFYYFFKLWRNPRPWVLITTIVVILRVEKKYTQNADLGFEPVTLALYTVTKAYKG